MLPLRDRVILCQVVSINFHGHVSGCLCVTRIKAVFDFIYWKNILLFLYAAVDNNGNGCLRKFNTNKSTTAVNIQQKHPLLASRWIHVWSNHAYFATLASKQCQVSHTSDCIKLSFCQQYPLRVICSIHRPRYYQWSQIQTSHILWVIKEVIEWHFKYHSFHGN